MRQILASAELTPDEFRELLLRHAELSPSGEAMKTAKCTLSSVVRRDLPVVMLRRGEAHHGRDRG